MPRSTNQATALIHLYRADVGRMTTYRQRLDTTTNWGITSSALVSTFALGNAQISHAAFVFLMLVNTFFLVIEARRFRAYEVARYRVLLLERTFFTEALGQVIDPRWVQMVLDALRGEVPAPNPMGSLGWRLRRTYIWIFIGVALAWFAKLAISPDTGSDAALQIIDSAHIGPIPGPVVFAGVALFYAGLAALALSAARTYPRAEEDLGELLLERTDPT